MPFTVVLLTQPYAGGKGELEVATVDSCIRKSGHPGNVRKEIAKLSPVGIALIQLRQSEEAFGRQGGVLGLKEVPRADILPASVNSGKAPGCLPSLLPPVPRGLWSHQME